MRFPQPTQAGRRRKWRVPRGRVLRGSATQRTPIAPQSESATTRQSLAKPAPEPVQPVPKPALAAHGITHTPGHGRDAKRRATPSASAARVLAPRPGLFTATRRADLGALGGLGGLAA